MKSRLNRGLDPQLYYFRDIHGHEVDCIFQTGKDLIPIEIKASETFHKEFLKNLQFFQTLTEKRCKKGFVIYAGSQEQKINDFEILNYNHAAKALES